MGVENVTLIKRSRVEALVGATVVVIIDFDVGYDEAIRILRVDATAMVNPGGGGTSWAQCELSLDPDDTSPDPTKDDRFAYMYVKQQDNVALSNNGELGARMGFDYSNINLLTVRNLAQILTASGQTCNYDVTIFYERVKVSQAMLNQLIMHRR